jgi:Leucine-rich repeat (LRR) protein
VIYDVGVATKKKIQDPLAGARAKPLTTRRIELGERPTYPRFPPEILACKNLVELKILGGIADDGDPEIPAELGTLTKLKRLVLGRLRFTELPSTIGKLAALEELTLKDTEALIALPEELGTLRTLRTLACSGNTFAELPSTIGELGALRSLKVSRSQLRSVPRSLWQCVKLEALDLPTSVEQLPSGIAALDQLQSLSLSAPAAASIAAELPGLPALTSLVIHGKATSLPAELGQLAKLERLYASYLGLTALPSLPPTLMRLSLAGSQLTTVRPLLAALPKLIEFDYSGNPVDREERSEVDALMTLPPARRQLKMARGA